jgi:hypothetical protein
MILFMTVLCNCYITDKVLSNYATREKGLFTNVAAIRQLLEVL